MHSSYGDEIWHIYLLLPDRDFDGRVTHLYRSRLDILEELKVIPLKKSSFPSLFYDFLAANHVATYAFR